MSSGLIVRWIFGIVLIILMGMLYWSSLLVEKDLKSLRTEMGELQRQLEGVRSDTQHLRHDLQNAKFSSNEGEVTQKTAGRPHMDPKYPNLLETDPFYAKTLPALLGPNFQPKGIRREDMMGRPENLHPFNSFRDVSMMNSMCTAAVSQLQFGKYETMAPNLAIKLEARPLPNAPTAHEYWVHLRDDIFWEPLRQELVPEGLQLAPHFLKRHPVTAYDFKFFYDAVMNPNVSESKAASLRNYYNDIEEIRVIDPLTFVVRWKAQATYSSLGEPMLRVKYIALGMTGALQPLPSFVFQYFADGKKIIEDDSDPDTYRKNSVWAQNFAQHWAKNVIASCGPWVFEGMSEEGIRFKRNANYYDPDANLVEGLTYTFREGSEAVWQDFKAGKIDMCPLAPSQQSELEGFLSSPVYQEQAKNPEMKIQKLEYLDLAFFYIGWNQATPFFHSKNVRQAMTMAIDRNRIIEQNLNDMGMPITGPFFRYSPAYDPEIESWPFNPQEARRLLDEEGWIDLDGDGIREKVINGKIVHFRFFMTYYAKNISGKVICEYISTALREVGVDCQLKGVDIADLSRTFEDKSFDALFMGWALGAPPENPRQLWYSKGAREKGSSNAIGFANPEIDQIIDDLEYEYDKSKRIALYHRFHRIIHEEQPYTFLFSPKRELLYRNYVRNLFIPRQRQDLVPGADITEPDFRVIWLAEH